MGHGTANATGFRVGCGAGARGGRGGGADGDGGYVGGESPADHRRLWDVPSRDGRTVVVVSAALLRRHASVDVALRHRAALRGAVFGPALQLALVRSGVADGPAWTGRQQRAHVHQRGGLHPELRWTKGADRRDGPQYRRQREALRFRRRGAQDGGNVGADRAAETGRRLQAVRVHVVTGAMAQGVVWQHHQRTERSAAQERNAVAVHLGRELLWRQARYIRHPASRIRRDRRAR